MEKAGLINHCKMEGCPNEAVWKSYKGRPIDGYCVGCRKALKRNPNWKLGLDPLKAVPPDERPLCPVCNEEPISVGRNPDDPQGVCRTCRASLKRNPDFKIRPNAKGVRSMTLEERFWAKVDKESSPDGCWLYFGFLDKDGYGVFRVGEKNVRAHRFSYELATGSIPDGLTIDHVVNNGCTNRNCVNPSHLEPVTTRINILRGDGEAAKNARKTHCLNGHPLEGQNLIIQKWPDGSIKGRGCRICKNAQDLARYHRMKTIEGRSRSKERPYNS